MSIKRLSVGIALGLALFVPSISSAQTSSNACSFGSSPTISELQACIAYLTQQILAIQGQSTSINVGDTVQVVADELKIRSNPSTNASVLGTVNYGTKGNIVSPSPREYPVEADGYRWWNVSWQTGLSGWSAEGNSEGKFITKVSGSTGNTGGPTIITSILPPLIIGQQYQANISATGGTGSYSWSIISGSLPPGLSLQPITCSSTPCQPPVYITGTPTAAGSYTFTMQLSVANSGSVTKTFTIGTSGGTSVPGPTGNTGGTAVCPPGYTCTPNTSGNTGGNTNTTGGNNSVGIHFVTVSNLCRLLGTKEECAPVREINYLNAGSLEAPAGATQPRQIYISVQPDGSRGQYTMTGFPMTSLNQPAGEYTLWVLNGGGYAMEGKAWGKPIRITDANGNKCPLIYKEYTVKDTVYRAIPDAISGLPGDNNMVGSFVGCKQTLTQGGSIRFNVEYCDLVTPLGSDCTPLVGPRVTASTSGTTPSPTGVAPYNSEMQQLLTAVNQVRRAHGLTTDVSWCQNLANAALAHTQDMVSVGFFSHTGSDGSNSSTRDQRAGYNEVLNIPREVIHYVPLGTSPDVVVNSGSGVVGWKDSPGHLATMITSQFRHAGGAHLDGNGHGYWTVDFGINGTC